jgi:hypothetical protein
MTIRPRTALVGAVSIVVGIFVLVCAHDLLRVRATLERDDARFTASASDPTFWSIEPFQDPRFELAAARRYWRLPETRPFSSASDLLGIDDDVRYRRALLAFWRSRPEDTSGIFAQARTFRGPARALLTLVARDDPDRSRRSEATNMLGILTMGGPAAVSTTDLFSRYRAAVALFRDAVLLDPGNDAAKRNLENVLSGFCLDCRSSGTNPSGSASGGSSAGAGSLGGGY